MNISSVVLRARPERIAGIRAALASCAGHEIHAEHADGRLALTIEDSDTQSAVDAFVALHDIPGVLAVSLIYQFSEEDPGPAASAAQDAPISELHEEAQS